MVVEVEEEEEKEEDEQKGISEGGYINRRESEILTFQIFTKEKIV